MANSSPADIIITYNADPITEHVTSINDISIEQIQEEVRALGETWDAYLCVGVGKVAPIELSGIYDSAADCDGLWANKIPQAVATAALVLIITWAAGKTSTVSVFITKYVRKIDKNGLTKYTVTLQPTGAVVEA